MNRKDFIRTSIAGGLALGLQATPLELLANAGVRKLTILHTNDVHSRVDPFPMDGTKLQGLGGCARRAAVINSIRTKEKNVLLLDSGDMFQGTPYFNKYHGEVEIKLMNEMKYDAGTFGNHDFDGGLDNLALRVQQAQFPFLIANYNTTNSPLNNKTKPYKVFTFGSLRIGVFGVGIELKGLVSTDLYGDIVYNDPIPEAQRIAQILKHDEKCDLVICLSHLGYSYDGTKVSDKVLAARTGNIDLILGGHTHTFFKAPEAYKNKDGKDVLINQVGWAGVYLGQIDFYFDYKNGKNMATNTPIKIAPLGS